MAIRVKKVTDMFRMQVFTDAGDVYGEIEEAILQGNKVIAWKMRATKNSKLAKQLTGAKGATVPHSMIKSVGDVVVISHGALPTGEEDFEEAEEF